MSTFSNNKVVLLNQANIVAKFFWPWVLLFFYFCTTVHMTSQANLCKYRTKLKNKMILPLSSIHYCSSSIKKLSISPKHKSNIFHKLLLLFCVYFIDCPMVSCSSRHFEKKYRFIVTIDKVERAGLHRGWSNCVLAVQDWCCQHDELGSANLTLISRKLIW